MDIDKSKQKVDLIRPGKNYKENYIYQVRQTVDAYSPTHIAFGEAVQNAIDAVCEDPKPDRGFISLDINIDKRRIEVRDNGLGFPKKFSYLYLGGGDKKNKPGSKGEVGVGLNVVLFSTSTFKLKSNLYSDGAWKITVDDACKFEELSSLTVPAEFPEDTDPLDTRGTQLSYTFPSTDNRLLHSLQEVVDSASPRGSFGDFVEEYKDGTGYPSEFATLFGAYLRRFTYAGDVLCTTEQQDRFPDDGIKVEVTITCSDPSSSLPDDLADLYGDAETQNFEVDCSYLTVKDTRDWVPSGKKEPEVFSDKVGAGGGNLETTNGFNYLVLRNEEEYKSLLKNKNKNISPKIEYFEDKLFEDLNGIIITMGRIPDLKRFLPNGSRRLISCNGVLTEHDIDLTRGRNQEYVRCLDIVVDVDSVLNYGKTQLKNKYMVKYVNEFVNEAYVRTLQYGTGEWVGNMPSDPPEEEDLFTGKEDLEVKDFTTWKEPRDENDVIGLFFELAGKGHIDDFRMYGLSQVMQYDGKATYQNKNENSDVMSVEDDSKLRTVEFKVHATDVMRDFERKTKYSREIDLLVAWDEGDYNGKYYNIYDIEESNIYDNSPPMIFEGVERFVYDAREGSETQVLLLNSMIEDIKENQQD